MVSVWAKVFWSTLLHVSPSERLIQGGTLFTGLDIVFAIKWFLNNVRFVWPGPFWDELRSVAHRSAVAGSIPIV